MQRMAVTVESFMWSAKAAADPAQEQRIRQLVAEQQAHLTCVPMRYEVGSVD